MTGVPLDDGGQAAPGPFRRQLLVNTLATGAGNLWAIVVSVVAGALQNSASSTGAGSPTTGASSTSTPLVSTGAGKHAYYRVRTGDTLATIADRLGVSIDTIYRLNPNIDEFNLQPGQRLQVS